MGQPQRNFVPVDAGDTGRFRQITHKRAVSCTIILWFCALTPASRCMFWYE